ncbi:MAG: ribonucleotide-diphosphate reductase subunit beta [Patescibacteria group bacterium UBA2103]
MQENRIFNPEGDDTVANRTIIKGSTTGLFQLNATKYSWAKKLYPVMVGNFWIPEKVMGLKEDANAFHSDLSPAEQKAYKGILSFLIFLDSVQTVNLPNISDYITAPEVNLLFAIQAYQEAIHSQSYATILESVVDSKERNEIYYFWKTDKTLLERNRYIGDIYQRFIDDPSDKNFFETLVADYLLEGLYFYNGFAFFDTLVDNMKMLATGRMIAYIRRDELTHVVMFANILNEIKKEFPEMFDEQVIIDMTKAAVDQEIMWSNHIMGEDIPGISKDTIREYTQWLANERMARIGIDPIYPEAEKNPYVHLERLQDTDNDKSNFFETTVVNYTQSTGLKGDWEF